MQLGVKSDIKETNIDNRLKHKPDTYEFYLTWDNIENPQDIIRGIEKLQKAGVKNIILHQPMFRYNSKKMFNLFIDRDREPELFKDIMYSTLTLVNIAEKYENVKVLLHMYYGGYERDISVDINRYTHEETLQNIQRNIRELQGYTDKIVYENGISGKLAYTEQEMIDFIIENNIPLCYDISHAYLSMYNLDVSDTVKNKKLIKSLIQLKTNIKHYHLVDTLGVEHDGLPLGKGLINLVDVKANLNHFATSIYEILLEDVTECEVMIDSHKYMMGL